MVASRQVEIPFCRSVGQQRGRGLSPLAQVIGRTVITFLRKYFVPSAKPVGADLLEFASPEKAEVVNDQKNFKTAAKSVERQTLRNQLGSGSKKRTASRIIPTKSAKQISPSPGDIVTNISHSSCRVIFCTNLLWQFLEILEWKSQQLTLSCPLMNRKSLLLPHLMKTA